MFKLSLFSNSGINIDISLGLWEVQLKCPTNLPFLIIFLFKKIRNDFAATLQQLISETMVRWAQESVIEDPELVRAMFVLLHRQYDGIGGLVRALPKTYTINGVSVEDTINLLASLGQIRSLLSVRMGKEEEKLMIRGLG